MELLPFILDRLIMAIAAAQAGIVIALSIIIIIYYSRHRSMAHIALVAASYVILTVLVSGAVIYQIFYDGVVRVIAIALAMIAFAIGDISLWIVWHNRKDMAEAKELKEMSGRLDRQRARIEEIEKELHAEPTQVVLAPSEVVKVEIVDGDDKEK